MRCRLYSLIFVFLTFCKPILAQQLNQSPPLDWFQKDPELDQLPGVSINMMYSLLKGRPSRTVIVAVIDTGVDIDHEDLKNVIWENEDEIANNGIDDDHNGYVDDEHGWNFIGGKSGNVNEDTYEVTRQYVRYKKLYSALADKSKLNKKEKKQYAQYLDIKKQWHEKRKDDEEQMAMVGKIYANAQFSIDTLRKYLKSDKLTTLEIASLHSNNPEIIFAKSFMRNFIATLDGATIEERMEEIKDAYDTYSLGYNYSSNPNFDPREIVGDNYLDFTEKYYGNNHVSPLPGPFGDHGTHVAGIIAADRKNNIGINGIADNVRIMPIRAIPNGDERDKDVANAIYYAVDNGAHIINLSAGKSESPYKSIVDKAVQYAEAKGVLIVHAAGNESANCDVENYFPIPLYKNGKTAKNWLNVAASSWGTDANLIGSFTNYGKKTVDVFAPGVFMYSTVPENNYKKHDGTSMACPVVSGICAVLMSYFPELTASDVKNIITHSVRTFDKILVLRPGSEEQIEFSQLSKTGGIVNGYDAVHLALSKN